MKRNFNVFLLTSVALLFYPQANGEKLLSCYQCNRTSEQEECGPQELKPCTTVSDRCVTSSSKSNKNGLLIERKCGLGPCDFEDIGINTKNIKLNKCDMDKNEYFCIYCCKENGCNKNSASSIKLPNIYLILTIIIIILSIFDKFQPPYVAEN